VIFKNPQGIVSGEYGSRDCRDERLWAAAELWRTTGEAQFNDFFLKNYADYLAALDTPPTETGATLVRWGSGPMRSTRARI